jgi:hypothetical protein
MRHFFGYRANGALGSVHTYHGGWPLDMDLRDPNSPSELVRKQRARFAEHNPDIVGFLAFDCSCDHAQGVCECVSAAHATMYAKNGELVAKPTTTVMKVDGVTVSDGERLIRPPGTKVQFHLECPDVPDGQEVNIFIKGAILHPDLPEHLSVSGGKTASLEITAPAQGSFGQFFLGGIMFIPARFDLVGFA